MNVGEAWMLKDVYPIFFLAKPDGWENRKAGGAKKSLTLELYTSSEGKDGIAKKKQVGTVVATEDRGYVTYTVTLQDGGENKSVSATYDTRD
jgi:hypothetical protein